MLPSHEELRGLLACPDDGAELVWTEGAFQCRTCAREFRPADGLLELLPLVPSEIAGPVSSDYVNGYHEEFSSRFERSMAKAWGARETMPATWVRKRERHVRWIEGLLAAGQDGRDLTLADFSAGAGYYTFAYAKHFRRVLHCDLCVDNLSYCMALAEQRSVRNILFLRIDYFRPPFLPALDRIICFDTLIRGDEHERVLLRGMLGSLATNGNALVDFHNWNHNPLRRLGLLPDNFAHNRSYTRRQLRTLLASAGVGSSDYFPFHQEFDPQSRAASVLARVIPPVRFVYRIRSSGGGTLAHAASQR